MSMNDSRVPSRESRERGAILITFALLLVLFFGLMALAVDASHAFVERRGSQSVADVAVIGGALQTIPNSATKEQNLVDEVLRLVNVNLDISTSTSAGSPWDVCDDDNADVLAFTWASSLGGPSDCISWDPGFTTVRVRVPQRSIATWFGGIIGVNSINVGAAAEAEVLTEGSGGVLPFGVLGNANDSVLCLKTGSGNGVPQTCEDNGTGNFHYIDFKTFGNGAIGTATACGQANKPERLKENIAHGVDHDLYIGLKIVPGLNYFDALVCDGTQPIDPLALEPPFQSVPPWAGSTGAGAEQGTVAGVVLDGLVQGTTVNGRFFPGRLAVTSGGPSYKGVPIDNVGLWSHLTPVAASACEDIGENQGDGLHGAIVGLPSTEDEIIACIDYFDGGDTSATPEIPAKFVQIFATDALKGSVRYGWVPILHQTTWPNGNSAPVSFQFFQPMYIQTMFGGKCFSDGTCQVSIIPGETWIGATGKEPNALTAIQIPDWSVPEELRDPKDQVPQVAGYALSR